MSLVEFVTEKDIQNIKQMKSFWNLYPEDPIKLHSVVEMVVFVFVFGVCYYLFLRWNTVPVRDIELRVEHISPDVDSINQKFCSIKMTIPMTSQDAFMKDSVPLSILSGSYEKTSAVNSLTYITFINDSLRSHKKLCNDIDITSDTPSRKYAESFGITSWEYIIVYKQSDKDLDSLYDANIKIDSSQTGKPLRYIWCEQTMPYGGFSKNVFHSNDLSYKSDSMGLVTNQIVNTTNDRFYTCATGTGGYVFSKYKLNMESTGHWYDFIDLTAPFSAGTPMETPKWGRLEDISQAYYNLKLRSVTTDSINLKIDFVGVTDFSAMDPMPDKISMSSIEFNDPVKIFKIRANGLRFHADFKELGNWQVIRLFVVTAIMSGFFIIFIGFLILVFFKFKRRKR